MITPEFLAETLRQNAVSVSSVPIDDHSELFIIPGGKAQFNRLCTLFSEQADETVTHVIGESEFCFLHIGGAALNLQYVPGTETTRLVYDKNDAYFTARKDTAAPTAAVKPLLSQLHLACIGADCGMSYVLRLCDGRFVLIDGGYNDYEESERLYDLLCAQNEVYEKPVIAAWFFSHPHDDHIGCFTELLEKHSSDIVLQRVIRNFAPPCYVPRCDCDHAAFDALLRTLADTTDCAVVTVRTGQRYEFADLTVDVLYTADDVYPNELRNLNDTSVILRCDFSERRILFLGDAMPLSSDVTAKRFGAGELSCELLQVGHHGYGGGSDAFNRACDPEALLWSCPAFWYPSVRLWKENDYLRNSEHIKNIYLSGFGTITLDMTAPLPTPATPSYGKGDTVYAEDYQSVQRIVDLGYESITGGQTGLVSAVMAFETDAFGRHLTLGADGTAVVGLLNQHRTAPLDVFTVRLRVRAVCEPCRFGIMVGNDMPNEWNSGKIQWFNTAAAALHDLTLCLDYREKTLRFAAEGEEPITIAWEDPARGGIYLALENSKLAVYECSVTADKRL